jgi:hypothetical protein
MAGLTATAIGGLAISGASTAMSFLQAGKQNKLQREAELKAAQALAEARKRLEVNFAEQRAIQKEPYELAREAILSTGAQAIQAGVESDRGAEVTAGKVQMAMNQGQGEIRTAMGQELTDIEKDIINEDSRLRDLGLQLDLGEVEGFQLAARDAQEARSAAITEGVKSAGSFLEQGLNQYDLYDKTSGARQTEKLMSAASKKGINTDQLTQNIQGLSSDPKFSYLSGLGGKDVDFNSFMSELSRKQIRNIGKEFKYEGYK